MYVMSFDLSLGARLGVQFLFLFFCIIFKIANIKITYFLKLCFDGLNRKLETKLEKIG
jgi:hypothetical protein